MTETILGIVHAALVDVLAEQHDGGDRTNEDIARAATEEIVGLVNNELEERTREVIRALAAVMVTDRISGLGP